MYQNHITGQTTLILNLDFSIPKNYLAQVISNFFDSIPDNVMLENQANAGRPAYRSARMLKFDA